MHHQIFLRPLLASDLDAFLVWATDDEVTAYLTWKAYTSAQEALAFLQNVAEKHPWFKAICLDNAPIGSITLTKQLFRDEEVAEIGYAIAKQYWGRGYTTQAVKKALETGFKDLGISTIISYVDQTHKASQKVLENSGFIFKELLPNYQELNGETTDRLLYVIHST